MKALLRDPVFLLGLAIRLLLITVATPVIHQIWFVPFLTHVTHAGTLVPWSSFLASGGPVEAFPYGLLYVLVYGPLTWIGELVAGPAGGAIGLSLTTLALDAGLYVALRRLSRPEEQALTGALYWLSPITLHVGYWHGQLDVFPVLLLTASLLFLRINRFRWSGYSLGLAIAAKASMVVALPFVAVYLIGSSRLRWKAASVLLPAAFVVFALIAPFHFSEGFRTMVLGTPEAAKATALAIPYGDGLSLFVFPVAYAGLLLVAWRVRRLGFDGLLAFCGAAFLGLFLLTPASPGWALWFMPFLAWHLARTPGLHAYALYGVFAVAFVVLQTIVSTGATLRIGDLALFSDRVFLPDDSDLASGFFSLFVLAGLVFLLQIIRTRVFQSRHYRATRAPFTVAIAGDSGAGKDTLSDLIVDMVGAPSAVELSGDDYHIWDRHKPMWRALTHLNPKANHLDQFAADAVALSEQRHVRRRHYDHSVGRMTKPEMVKPSDWLIVSGLHALHPRALIEIADMRIFLAMDERLRRFLKIRRDVTVRGHPLEKVISSIQKRLPDAARFIHPQREKAGLVLTLEAVRPSQLADLETDPADIPLRLRAFSRRAEDFTRLGEILLSVCGCYIVERAGPSGGTELVIEGEPSAADIAVAARHISPMLAEYLALYPVWRGGANGLIQLVVLEHLSRIMAVRGGR